MNIIITPQAESDLEDILRYYLVEAGADVMDMIESRIFEQIETLQFMPQRIKESDKILGTREMVVYKLPYLVFFVVDEEQEVVKILNIVHSARKFPL